MKVLDDVVTVYVYYLNGSCDIHTKTSFLLRRRTQYYKHPPIGRPCMVVLSDNANYDYLYKFFNYSLHPTKKLGVFYEGELLGL